MPDLDFINICLNKASDYNLEAEVIWAALQAMKQDPSLSINEAMQAGMDEWIK